MATSVISRRLPLRNSANGGYSSVMESEEAAADTFLEELPETALDARIEKHQFVLQRGPMGVGFGFCPAKESIMELKLKGWNGTHLMSLLSFAEDGGLYITAIFPDSPALEAGMQRYDVIQKVNDQDVRNWTAAEISTLIKTCEDVVVLDCVRHTDSMLREAQIQYDHVKDPLHKIRSKLMNMFKIPY